MAKNTKRVSPRQKMINLMYVVLMAMLAMNVSSDVLNGFTVVYDSLTRSADNATLQNSAIYDQFAAQMERTPRRCARGTRRLNMSISSQTAFTAMPKV